MSWAESQDPARDSPTRPGFAAARCRGIGPSGQERKTGQSSIFGPGVISHYRKPMLAFCFCGRVRRPGATSDATRSAPRFRYAMSPGWLRRTCRPQPVTTQGVPIPGVCRPTVGLAGADPGGRAGSRRPTLSALRNAVLTVRIGHGCLRPWPRPSNGD